jgi:hypothetical protein
MPLPVLARPQVTAASSFRAKKQKKNEKPTSLGVRDQGTGADGPLKAASMSGPGRRWPCRCVHAYHNPSRESFAGRETKRKKLVLTNSAVWCAPLASGSCDVGGLRRAAENRLPVSV